MTEWICGRLKNILIEHTRSTQKITIVLFQAEFTHLIVEITQLHTALIKCQSSMFEVFLPNTGVSESL